MNAEPLVRQVPTWEEVATQFVAVLERISSGGTLSREFTEGLRSATVGGTRHPQEPPSSM